MCVFVTLLCEFPFSPEDKGDEVTGRELASLVEMCGRKDQEMRLTIGMKPLLLNPITVVKKWFQCTPWKRGCLAIA